MNSNILITGGAGFIGSHLADALAIDNTVTILDNFSSGRPENLTAFKKNDGRVVTGNILDEKIVEGLVAKVDVVYHLAVQCVRLSFKEPDIVHEVNVKGTLNLLKAAAKFKIKRFIYVSSSEVYGLSQHMPLSETSPTLPTTIYGASKLAGEYYALAYLHSFNLPVIIVRPFNTYGPRSHFEGVYGEVIPKFFVRACNRLPPIIFGTGEQTRDFTYVDDIVSGLKKVLHSSRTVGEVINIAAGKEVSINQLARRIIKLSGNHKLRPLYLNARPADIPRLRADIHKAKQLLIFKPHISLASGLKKYCEWLSKINFNFHTNLKYDTVENWK